MAARLVSVKAKSNRVFGQRQESPKMLRAGLYARVSTHDQQTLSLQMRAMREYAAKRGWTIAVQIKEVGSGAAERELRENLLAAARRREIDVVLVWRLDRWGRSLVDLVVTLKELAELGVSFVSLTEALDLTTPTGCAMAGLLSVFAEFENEILRERIRAGIAEAKLKGKRFGRPLTAAKKAGQIRKLYRAGVSKAEIARRLGIGRTSVRRILADVTPLTKPRRDPIREDRIDNEAIVDARPEEQAMGWYYYLEGKIRFPLAAKCMAADLVSPLRKGETVEVIRMAPEDNCEHDMFVQVRWQGRKMAVPLSQLAAIDPDESTEEAIGDWHYWVVRGYIL